MDCVDVCWTVSAVHDKEELIQELELTQNPIDVEHWRSESWHS